MRYFSLFSGIGGFEKAIHDTHTDNVKGLLNHNKERTNMTLTPALNKNYISVLNQILN